MKRFYVLILSLVLIMTTNVFAYRWVENDGVWSVVNEDTNEMLKSKILDTGDGVYYLDKDGKMVIGWWQNPNTKKSYFFDNDIDRKYGQMVFGLHMIDGYYHYFGDDGSLQTSGVINKYVKVYEDYYADYKGYLYRNDELMRDVSIARSEYYTNPVYYTNPLLNNYYLANYDNSTKIEETTKSNINDDLANTEQLESFDGTVILGGTDYTINEYGKIIAPDKSSEIQPEEKYGPSVINY